MIVGAQFYTIREFCKDLDNLAESLKKVADIGYTTVQLSGTCPYDPAWMKEQLDKNGLKCVITHNASDALSNEPERLVKDHDILGCDYIGLGSHKVKDEDGMRYDDFFTKYLESAKYFKENGKYFMYHNHAHEFRKMDGKLILDKLAEDYDRALYRARNTAAPLNAKRIGVKTPCAKAGNRCYDCKSAERICRGLSVLWEKPMTGEFEIILMEEALGY